MRNSLLAIALALAILGCKDKAKDTPPASTGSGSVAGPVAAPDATVADPGSGSAAGSGSATAAACKDVEITLAKAGHVVRRDADQPVKLEELKGALSTLATACKGTVIVTANDDMDYQSMITAMDAAKAAGFGDIALHAKDAPATRTPPRPSGPPSITNAPIVQVTKKEISLVVGSQPPVAVGAIAEVDVKKLEEALAKIPNKDTPVIVQADAASSAKTINTIIVAAKRAGFGDLLFAIKNR